MHEASIAMSVLEAVIGQCRQEGYASIESVTLKIGKASGVLPDALMFAFDAAKQGTIAAGAQLIIKEIPLTAICQNCGQQLELEDKFLLECPSCREKSLRIATGYEMEIAEMEVN